MTSVAQVQANRANAQKSTGPRSPEGKAAVAQNAVRHGLLAKEVVIKGEDPGEFEFYRGQMLAELAPAGQLESLLAERIVSLSWRLRRAERLQTAAFDKIADPPQSLPVIPPEVNSKILAILAASKWRPSVPPEPTGTVGRRKAVQDFCLERVLDRLLVYERRIENSLYRTMAELRKLRKEGGITSSMGVPPMNENPIHGQACPELAEWDARATHGRDAHATEPPEGGTPNGEGNESCETNPISEAASSVQCEVASEPSHPAGAPGLPTSNGQLPTAEVGANVPPAPTPACQTKPIGEPASRPSNPPSQPRRIRKFPNTANEMTYDSYLGRWVWTGAALSNKDLNQADSGRRE